MNTVIIGQLKSGTRNKFDTRRLDKRLENLLFDNLVLSVTLTRRIILVKYNNHVAISFFVKKKRESAGKKSKILYRHYSH